MIQLQMMNDNPKVGTNKDMLGGKVNGGQP
jgi:hypothetical protein